MAVGVSSTSIRAGRLLAVVLAATCGLTDAASAQTTLTLTKANTGITDDTTIRGGGYASVKHSTSDGLVTKNDTDPSYVRRIVMKFDTENTIPKGVTINSATLVLTLKTGGAVNTGNRPLTAYRVTKSFLQHETTWLDYRSSTRWSSAGADLGEKFTTSYVGNTVGSTYQIDLTQLVQRSVNGDFGSRWTRLALVDTGSADTHSYREFYSTRAASTSAQPRLVISYGGSTTQTTTTAPSSSTATTLKVMSWNIHHGLDTSGKLNLDWVATVIANSGVHVAGLNEVEKNHSWYGNIDQAAQLRSLLESKTGVRWYYVFAKRDGNWDSNGQGNALFSRIPFSSTSRYALSYNRSVAHGSLVVNGRTVNVFATHVDYENASYRTTQTKQVRDYAATFAEQRIVVGDFNTTPGTSDYNLMATPYYDSWAEAVKKGVYSSPSGTAGYTHINGVRFDYVYHSRNASALALTRAQVIDTKNSSGVRASDHHPLIVTYTVN
jgi:endonuclease/exonuclease/phosphatase family metal-dependent hydrolase